MAGIIALIVATAVIAPLLLIIALLLLILAKKKEFLALDLQSVREAVIEKHGWTGEA